jgi:hypothetical protein
MYSVHSLCIIEIGYSDQIFSSANEVFTHAQTSLLDLSLALIPFLWSQKAASLCANRDCRVRDHKKTPGRG